MLRDFISLIFPRNCLNCEQSLISEEHYLCTACKIDLPLTNDYSNPSNQLYQKFAFEPKIKSATSFLYFQRKGITQKLLHELKYKEKKELGILLGAWFAPSLQGINIDIVIPVPLHKSKFRKRTYNQSELIAKGISENFNLEIRKDVIRREVATQSQTKKSKANRWINMENVYSKSTCDLSGHSVLVVDDVITTGATVGMLCQRLVESNVKEIHIACLARGK
ncbi:phosphoribosyltransferase family protein [Ekhidna sp.]|uniref:ComF family protein n=1 Tax=Ekhidna sp. TaxID=2608089 RepID=UPI0032984A9A